LIRSRRLKWVGQVVQWGLRNVYKDLVRNPEGKRLLVRPRHRWKGNIKMDLKEIGLEAVD
jgi:hypothetical protein